MSDKNIDEKRDLNEAVEVIETEFEANEREETVTINDPDD